MKTDLTLFCEYAEDKGAIVFKEVWDLDKTPIAKDQRGITHCIVDFGDENTGRVISYVHDLKENVLFPVNQISFDAFFGMG